MAGASVCAECGAKLVGGLRYTHAGKTYCYACHTRLVDRLKVEEAAKNKLYEYIRGLFSIRELPPDVSASIDRALAKGVSAEDIRLTLYFYYEICGHPRGSASQVPFVIRDHMEMAKAYEREAQRLREVNDDAQIGTTAPRTVVVTHADLANDRRVNKPKYKIEDL